MQAQQRFVFSKIGGSYGRKVLVADRARRSESIFRPLGFAISARSQKDISKHPRPSAVPVVERMNLHGPVMEHCCLFGELHPGTNQSEYPAIRDEVSQDTADYAAIGNLRRETALLRQLGTDSVPLRRKGRLRSNHSVQSTRVCKLPVSPRLNPSASPVAPAVAPRLVSSASPCTVGEKMVLEGIASEYPCFSRFCRPFRLLSLH